MYKTVILRTSAFSVTDRAYIISVLRSVCEFYRLHFILLARYTFLTVCPVCPNVAKRSI